MENPEVFRLPDYLTDSPADKSQTKNLFIMADILFTVSGPHYNRPVPSVREFLSICLTVITRGKVKGESARLYYQRCREKWRKHVERTQRLLDIEHGTRKMIFEIVGSTTEIESFCLDNHFEIPVYKKYENGRRFFVADEKVWQTLFENFPLSVLDALFC